MDFSLNGKDANAKPEKGQPPILAMAKMEIDGGYWG